VNKLIFGEQLFPIFLIILILIHFLCPHLTSTHTLTLTLSVSLSLFLSNMISSWSNQSWHIFEQKIEPRDINLIAIKSFKLQNTFKVLQKEVIRRFKLNLTSAVNFRPDIWDRDQGSISSTFYEQLLRSQIPNALKKNTVKPSVVFALLGSALVKAAHRTLMKLTTAAHYHRHLQQNRLFKISFFILPELIIWMKYFVF